MKNTFILRWFYGLLSKHKTKSVTVSLPLTLISEIENKQGTLPISLAYKILLTNGLAAVKGPLIQNIPGGQS